MFERWEFWAGAFYVCFPLGALLYAWNDLFDKETDRINDRKDSWLFGAKLNDEELARVPVYLLVTQLPFLALFTYAAGWKMLLWFAAIFLANALYNGVGFGAPKSWDVERSGKFPGWGWKNWPALDLANQVGYLLVFVLASWLLDVPQLSVPALVFSALFAMQSHLFGQLMDIDEDVEAGRRTTASVIGVRNGKFLVSAFMFVETWIAWEWFQGPWVAGFMALGGLWFLIDGVVFKDRVYPSWFTKAFFIGWNLVVLATMYIVWRTGWFLVG